MNNFKKVGLSALAGSLAVVSAQASEMTVTGDTQIVWTSQEGNQADAATSNGKGIGVDTDVYFNASGELDNGFTLAFFTAQDMDGSANTSSMQATLGMGSLGTIVFADVGGSSANAIDDVLPFAYEETWDGTSHTSVFHGFGGSTTSGAIDYRTPSFSIGDISISGSYVYDPNAGDTTQVSAGGINAAAAASGEAYTVKVAGYGFTVGGGNEEVVTDATSTSDLQRSTVYAKYSNGPITVGYQEFYTNSADLAADLSGDGIGISFAQDNYSISYAEIEEGTDNLSATTAVQTELSALQATYTMGAMTLGVSLYETDNPGAVAATKYEETEVSLSFAF